MAFVLGEDLIDVQFVFPIHCLALLRVSAFLEDNFDFVRASSGQGILPLGLFLLDGLLQFLFSIKHHVGMRPLNLVLVHHGDTLVVHPQPDIGPV